MEKTVSLQEVFSKEGSSLMPFLNTLAVNQCSPRLRDSILIALLSHPYQNMSSYSLMGHQWTFLLLLKPTQGHPVLCVSYLNKQSHGHPLFHQPSKSNASSLFASEPGHKSFSKSEWQLQLKHKPLYAFESMQHHCRVTVVYMDVPYDVFLARGYVCFI